MAKKETVAQRIARLAKGGEGPAVVVEKVEKKRKSAKLAGTAESPWKGNGGARKNAGRKPLEDRKVENRQNFQDFAADVIETTVREKNGKERNVKMTRLQVAWLQMFQGVLKGDMRAIEEFNDRAMDRSVQPVGGSDTAPIRLLIDF